MPWEHEVSGSSPLTPTSLDKKPFGENVEGLSCCGDASYAAEAEFKQKREFWRNSLNSLRK